MVSLPSCKTIPQLSYGGGVRWQIRPEREKVKSDTSALWQEPHPRPVLVALEIIPGSIKRDRVERSRRMLTKNVADHVHVRNET